MLGNDEVRAFQMFIACFLFSSATLHFKTFRHHVLHQAHVNFTELAGFACLMIHPVPYDMGMAVRFPCGVVARYAVMSLVLVDEDLQGCDSPSIMAAVAILPKLVYGRVLFAHHHALTKRRTAIDDFCLAGLLSVTVRSFVCMARPVFSFTIRAISL